MKFNFPVRLQKKALSFNSYKFNCLKKQKKKKGNNNNKSRMYYFVLDKMTVKI